MKKGWREIEFNGKESELAMNSALSYLTARCAFLEKSEKNSLLAGNDNFIGRIAEMLAIRYFMEEKHRGALNFDSISRPESKSNKGIDFVLKNGTGLKHVSVKCITSENSSKRTSRIRWEGDSGTPASSPPEDYGVLVIMIRYSNSGFDWKTHLRMPGLQKAKRSLPKNMSLKRVFEEEKGWSKMLPKEKGTTFSTCATSGSD